MTKSDGENRESRSSNTDMTPPRLDQRGNERLDRDTLAALIDGRLQGAARDAALASLAISPEDLEVVADVAAVSAELDDGVTDIRAFGEQRRARRPQLTRWLAAAAAIVVVATLPVMLRRGASPTVDGYAGLLSTAPVLREGWEAHSWSATRGSTDGITELARAVRAGALTTAIDLAVAHQDSAAQRLALQVAALFRDVPGASDVISAYNGVAKIGTTVPVEQLRDARHAARDKVAGTAFDEGAWLEAARIAAEDHDSTFFAASVSRARVADLQRAAANDPRIREDLTAMNRSIERHDWDALAGAATNILAELAAR